MGHPTWRTFLLSRAPLVGTALLLAYSCSPGGPRPQEASQEGILEALQQASQQETSAFHWEPSRGWLAEFIWGRPVLFLAQPGSGRGDDLNQPGNAREDSLNQPGSTRDDSLNQPGSGATAAKNSNLGLKKLEASQGDSEKNHQPGSGHRDNLNQPGSGATHDLFRAFVRLAPNGTPLSLRSVRNLTQTALADEQALRVEGALAVYATVRAEQVESLTALHLTGAPTGTAQSLLGRAQLYISRWLETGDPRGFGRTDLHFSSPQKRVELLEEEGSWRLSYDNKTVQLPATLFEAESPSPDFSLTTRVQEPTPFLHWAADVGRAWVGSGPIAWLEGHVFRLRDRGRRWLYAWQSPHSSLTPPTPATDPSEAGAPHELTPPPEEPSWTWPPPSVAPLLTPSRPQEGTWTPLDSAVLPTLPDPAPLFYRSFIHPDAERPYAELHLVAIDTRRLELGMRAGYEDPQPETGPPGSGHVPSEPEFYPRLVATFNGAFKTIHGQYGMVAEGRLLVRPVSQAATIRVDQQGTIGLGSFPVTEDPLATLAQEQQSGLVSLRQNLDPLVENRVPNPRGRRVWGDHLYGESVATERSALCVTDNGHLLYAWSPELTAEALALALSHAGCDYAVHLDMNPGHCTFALHRMESFAPVKAQSEVLDPRMRVNPNRYLRWSPKDFFYLALPATQPTHTRLTWQADHSLFAETPVLRAEHKLGHVELELLRLPLRGVRLGLQPGKDEAPGQQLSPAIEPGAALAWGLGHQTSSSRAGLGAQGRTLVPSHRSFATLVLPPQGPPELLPPGLPAPENSASSWVQLPVLARDGQLTGRARALGDSRERAALCLTEQGDLLVGRQAHDTLVPLVQTLLDEGCSLIVALDRGSHHPAWTASGAELQPDSTRAQSLLIVSKQALRPRAYHWTTKD